MPDFQPEKRHVLPTHQVNSRLVAVSILFRLSGRNQSTLNVPPAIRRSPIPFKTQGPVRNSALNRPPEWFDSSFPGRKPDSSADPPENAARWHQ